MTIGKKIIGGYVVVLALLAIVMFIAFYSLARIQATYDGFIDVDERLVEGAGKLRFEMNVQVAIYRGILLYPDLQNSHQEELQASRRQVNEIIGTMRQLAHSAEGRSMLEEIATLQAKNEQIQDQVIELAQQGKPAEALALGIKEVRPLNRTLDD